MTIEVAQAFVARVPWQQVQHKPYAYRDGKLVSDPSGKPPDPHQYVILEWREGGSVARLRMFCALIRRRYRATYRAPYRPD